MFTANISGSVRRGFVVSAICTGYGLGVVFQTVDSVLSTRYAGYKTLVILIVCNGVMLLAVSFYGAWLFVQNRIKKNVIKELGLSEEESTRLGSIATDMGMTDIENIHFQYQF